MRWGFSWELVFVNLSLGRVGTSKRESQEQKGETGIVAAPAQHWESDGGLGFALVWDGTL